MDKLYKYSSVLLLLIISVITFICYYSSLNAPFIFDDIPKITENPDIRDLHNLKTKLIYPYSENRTYYRNDPSRPIVSLSLTLNYYFGKYNTYGYHLFNVFIHILNCMVMFLLSKKIYNYSFSKVSIVFPFLVVLYFSVHPINIDAVTYVFARSEILATLFFNLSVLFYLKSAENNIETFTSLSPGISAKSGKISFFIISLICFPLALFSKQTAVTLPLIILIADYILLSDLNLNNIIKNKYYHLSFWVVLFLYLMFRYFYLGGIGDVEAKFTFIWDKYKYLLIQPYAITKYLKLLLIPEGFSIYHKVAPAESIPDLRVIIPLLIILGIFILTYLIYRKKNAYSKPILFFVLWFFINLLPTSSISPTAMAMSERRIYFSGLAFFSLFVFIYFFLFRIMYGKRLKVLFIILIGFHISTLCLITINRNKLFNDPIKIWEEVISRDINNYYAHDKLGYLYFKKNDFEKAVYHYQMVIKTNNYKAKAYHDLGVVYFSSKNCREAEQYYRKSFELDPNYAKAYHDLGALYATQKNYREAEQYYKKAIELNPKDPETYCNLGTLYYYQKKYDEALKMYRIAINLNTYNPDYFVNMGAAYFMKNNYNDARKAFLNSLRLNPDNPNVRKQIEIIESINHQ